MVRFNAFPHFFAYAQFGDIKTTLEGDASGDCNIKVGKHYARPAIARIDAGVVIRLYCGYIGMLARIAPVE